LTPILPLLLESHLGSLVEPSRRGTAVTKSTETVAVTVELLTQGLGQVTDGVPVTGVRLAAASIAFILAWPAVLLNGVSSAATRAPSRAASDMTPTVSQSRLISNVPNNSSMRTGSKMVNSTSEDPRSTERF
jgi:hypothetical protein